MTEPIEKLRETILNAVARMDAAELESLLAVIAGMAKPEPQKTSKGGEA